MTTSTGVVFRFTTNTTMNTATSTTYANTERFRDSEPQEGTAMTIASMEELEALPVGTSVKVAAARGTPKMFTRTEKGFEFEGTVIDTRFFAGHVAAGEVSDYTSGDPEPGDHFHHNTHRYVILSVEDGRVWMMDFYNATWRSIFQRSLTEVRGFRWRRILPENRPAWHDMAYALGTQMRAAQAESQRVAAQWNEAMAELGAAQRDVTRMRETRAAQVQAVATGVTRLPLEKADGHVPDGCTVVDVVASWRREFTITTEPAQGCQCGTVSREKVAELLGIPAASDFGYQVDCGRH